jgi:hypothetical protein
MALGMIAPTEWFGMNDGMLGSTLRISMFCGSRPSMFFGSLKP